MGFGRGGASGAVITTFILIGLEETRLARDHHSTRPLGRSRCQEPVRRRLRTASEKVTRPGASPATRSQSDDDSVRPVRPPRRSRCREPVRHHDQGGAGAVRHARGGPGTDRHHRQGGVERPDAPWLVQRQTGISGRAVWSGPMRRGWSRGEGAAEVVLPISLPSRVTRVEGERGPGVLGLI